MRTNWRSGRDSASKTGGTKMNKLLKISEGFAIFFTLAVLQFLIFGVIAPLPAFVLILASWLPYLGAKAYFEIEEETIQ
jgi:hypothetical protein